MGLNDENLRIILDLYAKRHISEDEAVKLINGLEKIDKVYYPQWIYYPTYTQPYSEVTCQTTQTSLEYENNTMSEVSK